MFKHIKINAVFNERTGYGIHASRFFPALHAKMQAEGAEGTCYISLLDTVSASQAQQFPPAPSILFNVWESTEQPQEFINKLANYTQLWVPSEWQRAASIAQGIPEEFVKVVHEGVDPEKYKPRGEPVEFLAHLQTFNFLHVGQWQPRKSTREIVEAFLKAFPMNNKVRLYLSTDTLFPSDEYKSTEERLKAYGLNDPRIIVVHHEAREEYIRRLQSAHCFVSCSRAEGWGLPIIEAMACGIPTIVADWGGSTEFAGDALHVRIRKLIKPFGIYGNWDVPGQWCEPDYDHLVEVLQDSFNNFAEHKKKALATSEIIRSKFSWDVAADQAHQILEELSQKTAKSSYGIGVTSQKTEEASQEQSVEKKIRAFATGFGYEIEGIRPRKAIFAVNTWPDSQAKMDTLVETIDQIHAKGFPVLLTTHYPLPQVIVEKVEFCIYDKEDILSGDDKAVYWRQRADGTNEEKQCRIEYHGVAALNCLRNAIDFCRGRYDWIYSMGSDIEVDLDEWLNLVTLSDKPMVFKKWEGGQGSIDGSIWAARTEYFDKIVPRLRSWKEYAEQFPQLRFCAEQWVYAYIKKTFGDSFLNEIDWVSYETTNRFDQVDRELWPDDMFQCHFVEGPFLNITGLSRREYDVTFRSSDNEIPYGTRLKVGMWGRPSKKYYQPWVIEASLDGVVKFRHELNLKGKRVLISLGSRALGDTIAWIPYVEEFRKKHDCHVICSGWWQNIFDYPEIEFVKPGSTVENIYASYDVGCFDDQPDKNPVNWRTVPLQKVAADILGIAYKPIKARLKVLSKDMLMPLEPLRGRYICFSEFSTMQGKLWNLPGAWQVLVDDLINLEGYSCVSVSAEKSNLERIISHNGQSIEQTIQDIAGCDFYIGLNHGPAWIAYALGKPCIMITGVSEKWNDFPNPYRVSVDVGCKPCFNDPTVPIDRGWHWCPSKKDYACTRAITVGMVMERVQEIRRKMYASAQHYTAAGHGDRRAPSGRPLQAKPRPSQNAKRKVARVRRDEGKRTAAA